MTDLVLDSIDPAMLVSANKRIHHHKRAEVARYWRAMAHVVARQVYGPLAAPAHERVRIIVTYRFPDLRRRDVGNLYTHVAKPLVDGIVDAGILPDDDDRHVTGPDPRRDFERGPHRVTLTIEAL